MVQVNCGTSLIQKKVGLITIKHAEISFVITNGSVVTGAKVIIITSEMQWPRNKFYMVSIAQYIFFSHYIIISISGAMCSIFHFDTNIV